ncbi:MAG TPA: acyl-CoA dehydrogenase, partial [Catalimonadaceae bacterium]|nr:acyl-CoA dehydrogenase [Catalimonadaceae bacterium]
MKNEIDLVGPAMKVQQEIMSIPDFGASEPEGFLMKETAQIERLKKAFLMVSGAAVQKLMTKIESEQEVMMCLADILIEIYAIESAVLRTQKLAIQNGEASVEKQKMAVQVYLYDATEKIAIQGRQALNSFATGDELRMMQLGLKRFTKQEPLNTIQLRRDILTL